MVDKGLLKEAIRASLDLQSVILKNQEELRQTCNPYKCPDAHLVKRWGLGIFVCNVCDRR